MYKHALSHTGGIIDTSYRVQLDSREAAAETYGLFVELLTIRLIADAIDKKLQMMRGNSAVSGNPILSASIEITSLESNYEAIATEYTNNLSRHLLDHMNRFSLNIENLQFDSSGFFVDAPVNIIRKEKK